MDGIEEGYAAVCSCLLAHLSSQARTRLQLGNLRAQKQRTGIAAGQTGYSRKKRRRCRDLCNCQPSRQFGVCLGDLGVPVRARCSYIPFDGPLLGSWHWVGVEVAQEHRSPPYGTDCGNPDTPMSPTQRRQYRDTSGFLMRRKEGKPRAGAARAFVLVVAQQQDRPDRKLAGTDVTEMLRQQTRQTTTQSHIE